MKFHFSLLYKPTHNDMERMQKNVQNSNSKPELKPKLSAKITAKITATVAAAAATTNRFWDRASLTHAMEVQFV